MTLIVVEPQPYDINLIHFSISQLSLICLTSVGFPTIRTGTLPIRMTDDRYQVIFLHGSTCLLAINAKICPIGHTFQPFWVRDVEVSTHWLLRISPYGYRRRDVRVQDVHHSVMHEQQRERGNHLPFMIGRNSCYLITGWNLGFYPYPDWSSSHSKFLTNHKMSTIWIRTAFVCFVQRVFCSCPRGLSCAVGLRNKAVFPSSFP